MFKLTFNNIELSLYFSIRHFFFKYKDFGIDKIDEKIKNGTLSPRMSQYLSQQARLYALDNIFWLRENLYSDRLKFVKRNKFKFFYLFLLFIIVVEYYIPTLIIRNEMIEIMKESINFIQDYNEFKNSNELLNITNIDITIENSSNKLWLEESQKIAKTINKD